MSLLVASLAVFLIASLSVLLVAGLGIALGTFLLYGFLLFGVLSRDICTECEEACYSLEIVNKDYWSGFGTNSL